AEVEYRGHGPLDAAVDLVDRELRERGRRQQKAHDQLLHGRPHVVVGLPIETVGVVVTGGAGGAAGAVGAAADFFPAESTPAAAPPPTSAATTTHFARPLAAAAVATPLCGSATY